MGLPPRATRQLQRTLPLASRFASGRPLVGNPRGSLLVRLRHRLMTLSSTEPSFARKHAERQRVRRAASSVGCTEPVWSINAKQDAYRWVDEMGVRRPALLADVDSVDELDWEALPTRFVLKPNTGAGGHGVLLLERHASGYRDVLRSSLRSRGDVADELRVLAQRGAVSRRLLVEEMVEDPQRPGQAPVDWKVYTFFGSVGMVLARSPGIDRQGRQHPQWRVFDASWRDLGDVYAGHPPTATIPVPVHARELVELAARLSAAVPRPFLRVDLYDDVAGPVFGEITPEPGGRQRLRRDVDRALGELWENAEARLMLRAAAAGVLDPASEPLPESALVLLAESRRSGPDRS